MITRDEIKPGMIIQIPDDYKGHGFSNIAAGWIIVIYYTCEHLCTGMNVKKMGVGMDIAWQDIEHGKIIGCIPEPEDDFYHWVAEGRSTYSGETKEHGEKKRIYRDRFRKLVGTYFPEYIL